MSDESQSTPAHAKSKSSTAKPYPDFPLTPHRNGQWCKKIKGRLWYFGTIAGGWQAALSRYKNEVDDIQAGRVPKARTSEGGLLLIDLLNRFLAFKRSLVDSGRLTMRSWYDYHQTGERLLKVFGPNAIVENLRPSDFEVLLANYATTWKTVKIGNEINRARMLFRYAAESDLIDKPVRFGQAFKRPGRKELRKSRAKTRHAHGARMFTAEELRRIVEAAAPAMKAMVFLGINGGLSNTDVATLPRSAVDLDQGWVDFPRAKTGVDRRIPLWPETVDAIQAWLEVRPEPKNEEDDGLVFLTVQRRPWYRVGRFVRDDNGAESIKGINSPVSQAFTVLLANLKIGGRRNFLALRHTFRTIGRGARDREAIDCLMGHADESMAANYLEDGLPDERLLAVTEFVRKWLFGR